MVGEHVRDGLNLDIDDRRVPDLKPMRRRLRKRGIFGLVGGTGDGPGSG